MNLLSSFGPAAAAAAVTVSTTPVLSDSPSTCTSLSSAASHHINSSSGTNGYTNLTGHPAGHSLPPTSHPFNSSQFHPHSIAGHNGYGSSGQSHLSNYLGGSGNNLTATSGHTPLAEYGIMNNLSIPMYATKRRRRNSKCNRVQSKEGQAKSNPSKRHRERLNQELDNLATLLPYDQSVLSKLDKLSILRLSVSYLRTKSYFQDVLGKERDRIPCTISSEIEGDLILQALSGFLLILTCDGEVFYTSHTVETYLGFHQSDICHQSVYELVHSEDREELQRHLMWNSHLPSDRGNITIREGLAPENWPYLERNFTVRFRCLLDNTSGFLRLDIRGRVKVLHGQNHKSEDPPLALFAVCTPFGPPSLMETPNKDSTFKSKHKLDFSFLSMDSRGRQLLGYSESEIINRGGYDLVHYDDLAYVASAHQELLKTGASGLIAYRLLVKDTNKWQWLQSSARLVYKNSKPDFILCSHRPLMEEEGRDLLGKRTMDFKVTYLDGGLGAMTERSSSSASLMSDSEFVMRCQRNRRYKGSKEGSAGGGSASASPGSTCSSSHKGSQHMADVTMLNGSTTINTNTSASNGALVNNNNSNSNNNSSSLVNNQLSTMKGSKRKASASLDSLPHHQAHSTLSSSSMPSGGASGCSDPYALPGLTAEAAAAAAAAAASINFGHHHSTHHQLHHHTHHTQYPGHHLNPSLTSHHGAHHAALTNSMYHTLSHSGSPGAVTSPASGHTHNGASGGASNGSASNSALVGGIIGGSTTTSASSDQLSPSGGSGSGGTSVLSAPSPPPNTMAALNAAYAAAATIPPNFLTAMDYHNHHAAARSFLAPDSFLHYSRHALGSYYPDHPYHPHAHPTHQYTTNYY